MRTWTDLFPEASASAAWMHSGVAVAGSGEVVVAAPEGDALVFLHPDGGEARRVATGTTDLHGIVRDEVDGDEVFWVADHGHKFVPDEPVYAHHRVAAQVLAVDGAGRRRRELLAPDHPAYRDAGWSPTSIAVHGVGTDRRVWVADGYGASLLHAFDSAGTCILTVDGSDSGLAFDCPHGVVIDDRWSEPVLVVADRANQRLVELDLDGRWRRTFADGQVWSPSGLAIDGGHLLVTELWGDLVVLDADGGVVERFSPRPDEPARPGWPNAMARDVMVRPSVELGRWNSPHGIAVDPSDGSWVVTEWFIGGRVVRLRGA